MLLPPVFLCGCDGIQSALDPHGQSAVLLRDLIIGIVIVCTIVWLAVMATLVWALQRRRDVPETAERRLRNAVIAAVAGTVVIITGLTIASFYTTRGLGPEPDVDLTIRVRAQQWWWQFIYEDKNAAKGFQAANEIHIPVGKTIRVLLESTDVIHSFWVPSLAGKQDLIPGRENILTFRADKPGVYRGQCAEFCGLQHSHMAFVVIAEDEQAYRQWEAAQRAPAKEPDEVDTVAGKRAFLAKQCSACHTIRGTEATGTSGPDLTHVGSRATVGAGLLNNTRGSLAAWIADPQTLKPGNNMPLVPLSPEELRQISAYMESLK
nr:cytochrome c oxidase subunit II [Rhizobium cauense]